jgi:hypothetical protein
MTEKELESLKFPIGKFTAKENVTGQDIRWYINTIELFPAKLKHAVSGLTDVQLDTPYREGGWSIRQVVHHTADSHMNSYIRFKLALTEEMPAIRPYLEDRWAELPEARTGAIELSLPLIEALHKRWVVMLKDLKPEELKRKLYHPESKMEMSIEYLIGLYAWHSEHHLAHIVNLQKRMGWL